MVQTRGGWERGPSVANKRKESESSIGSVQQKRLKSTSDWSESPFNNKVVGIPFNKEGCRYHIVEKDKQVHDKWADAAVSTVPLTIPGHCYRITPSAHVTLSPNDRAYQLEMSYDHLSIKGNTGYCVARATHSVAAGKWYYEVKFTKAAADAAVRIGWAQQHSPVQACVGYSKFSYGWRSKKGTKFHAGVGKTYYRNGFKEGDVLGCLISLPFDPVNPGPDSSKYLPFSGKNSHLIKFRSLFFFEERDNSVNAEQNLESSEGSYMEFFHNGISCGVAFTDLYRGFYFPALSLYHQAELTANFGPTFTHPPPEGVKPMSERAEEFAVHQTLSDVLYLVEKGLYREIPPLTSL